MSQEHGWNDLPHGFIPGVSHARNLDTPSATPATSDSATNSVSPDLLAKVNSSLDHLLNLPSKLPQNQHTHHAQRIKSAIGTMSQHQLEQVSSALDSLDSDRQASVRTVVDLMLHDSVASSWCQPLRRLIENVQ
ncbi:hypothetical protein CANCADRAFT_140958 [Tortispora caseinolytica NRRL Y-17796]|uniref:Uncharacterized protein n=1 Tax=Tortispora caseinolytica NRRL Y-17796 TaxID=767744 RepID=A0A1E4TCY9_9ASCO|nr:hypothetical protein CANCADRAFT_140958 [Tortispora caseinolytica NRRL Y-17796]